MSNGRTLWWAKDAAWHERETIVQLGAEFGAEGPHLIDVLSCQAKLENRGGLIKTGYMSLARRSFIDADRVRLIVARAVELGAIDDFAEAGLTFEARVSGWESDQEIATSRERQRRYRERQAAAADDLTEPEPPSPVTPVTSPTSPETNVTKTVQDKTEQKPATQAARPRGQKIDQTKRPEGFPDRLVTVGTEVLPILRRIWDVRGGVEPLPRGVGLSIMRNEHADHLGIARELEQYMTSPAGQRIRCGDIAKRYGDRVAEAPASVPLRAVLPVDAPSSNRFDEAAKAKRERKQRDQGLGAA